MNHSPFSLSEAEFSLVTNSDWIFMKQRIIGKVYDLFGELSVFYQDGLHENNHIPEEVLSISPKIFRGEHYRSLPYVTLDFPRAFGKENTCAIRSFFWWGNAFSIHVLLSGKYLDLFRESLKKSDIYTSWKMCIYESPWEHHFEEDNYRKFSHSEWEAYCNNTRFFKIGTELPLAKWEEAESFFKTRFLHFLQVIQEL